MMCRRGGKKGGSNKNVADLTMFFMFRNSLERLSTPQFLPHPPVKGGLTHYAVI